MTDRFLFPTAKLQRGSALHGASSDQAGGSPLLGRPLSLRPLVLPAWEAGEKTSKRTQSLRNRYVHIVYLGKT